VNGPTIAEAIADPTNRITSLVAAQSDDTKLVEELFVAILDRFPSSEESVAGIAAINAAKEEYQQLQAKLDTFEREQLPARQTAWEKEQQVVTWSPLTIAAANSTGGATLTRQADESLAVSGASPVTDMYTLLGTTSLQGITALRIEALPDASLPSSGPGRAANGNFVLGNVRVTAAPLSDLSAGKPVTLQGGVADFSQEGYPVVNAIDGDAKSGWAVSTQAGKPHVAIFEIAEPLGAVGGTALSLVLDQSYGEQHTLGHFRISVTTAPKPVKLDTTPAAVAEALTVAVAQRTPEQQSAITAYYRTQDADLTRLNSMVEAARQAHGQYRLQGAQDLSWALINSPAFLFSR
jgi:hypothetical protein